jgi:hypothetical protein
MPDPPPKQTLPIRDIVQSTQAPLAPHASGLSPVTHAFSEQQNPSLQLPSPGKPHSLTQELPSQVGVSSVQGWQAVPSDPHAPLALPSTHVPLAQHPPLHCELESHCVVHTAFALHVSPVGQSVEAMQPQLPPARQ